MGDSDDRREPKGRSPFENVLTAPEVAEEKGVSPTTVVKAIREGRLPAWFKGGVYFVPRRDVDAWEPVRGRGRRSKGEG